MSNGITNIKITVSDWLITENMEVADNLVLSLLDAKAVIRVSGTFGQSITTPYAHFVGHPFMGQDKKTARNRWTAWRCKLKRDCTVSIRLFNATPAQVGLVDRARVALAVIADTTGQD